LDFRRNLKLLIFGLSDLEFYFQFLHLFSARIEFIEEDVSGLFGSSEIVNVTLSDLTTKMDSKLDLTQVRVEMKNVVKIIFRQMKERITSLEKSVLFDEKYFVASLKEPTGKGNGPIDFATFSGNVELNNGIFTARTSGIYLFSFG